MTALISAVALVVIAIYILMEAYKRLIAPQPILHPLLFITVAVIGLIGNLLSVWFLRGEKGKSLNLKTAFLHMAYDTLSSVAVIMGGVAIMLTGWVLIDAILSAVIALMIFWSSYLVIKEAVMIFLEAVPPGIDFDKILAALEGIPLVQEVHDLHIWSLSSHEVALSCHVSLQEKDFQSGPNTIVQINRMLKERFGIGHGTIQLEKESCARRDLLCRHNDHHWE
jgi:cobalt-zinc-cadmium efflux system protein